MGEGDRLAFFLQVAEMKKELVELQPKLEVAKIENNKMMKVTTSHTFITSRHQYYSLEYYTFMRKIMTTY